MTAPSSTPCVPPTPCTCPRNAMTCGERTSSRMSRCDELSRDKVSQGKLSQEEEGDAMADVTDLTIAQAEIRRRVAAIGAEQWSLPTPCSEWDVADLVAHLV